MNPKSQMVMGFEVPEKANSVAAMEKLICPDGVVASG